MIRLQSNKLMGWGEKTRAAGVLVKPLKRQMVVRHVSVVSEWRDTEEHQERGHPLTLRISCYLHRNASWGILPGRIEATDMIHCCDPGGQALTYVRYSDVSAFIPHSETTPLPQKNSHHTHIYLTSISHASQTRFFHSVLMHPLANQKSDFKTHTFSSWTPTLSPGLLFHPFLPIEEPLSAILGNLVKTDSVIAGPEPRRRATRRDEDRGGEENRGRSGAIEGRRE